MSTGGGLPEVSSRPTHTHPVAGYVSPKPTVSIAEYVMTSQFWFESLQNWQREFVAIVGLSIFQRQRGSPESKAVAEPHRETSA